MQPPTPYGGDQPFQQFNAGAPGAPAVGRRVRLGDLLTLIGGVFVFFFSFAPFMTYPDSAVSELIDGGRSTFDGWFMAWSTQMFMAPLTWWVIFAGLGLIGLSAVRFLTGRDPELLRFRTSQLQLAFALFAFFVLLGYALSHKQISFGLDKYLGADAREYELYRPSFGWGGYLMLIGAIVATAGAVLNHFNLGPDFAIPTKVASNPPSAQQWPGGAYPPPAPPPGQEGVFPAGARSPYPQQGYPPAPHQQGFGQPPVAPPTQQFQTPPGYQQPPPTT
jgi:hypothetical protein